MAAVAKKSPITDDQLALFVEAFMPKREEMADGLKKLVRTTIEETVRNGIREVSTEIHVRTDLFGEHREEGLFHKQFEEVAKAALCGNVMLVGPAGSGKTTLAGQVAKAFKLPFYFTGAISNEFKLTGFINAQGTVVSTEFFKAFTEGGVFLFDEMDASLPSATMAFNAALSNDWMDFPGGRATRHKNFVCLAACNTFGRGADRVYVGRNQQDAASLDRFITVNLDYDEGLELAVAGDGKWVNYVQRVRKAVFDLKLRHVVSPRASIHGARLIKAGFTPKDAAEMVIWKGLDKDSRTSIESRAGSY